MPDFVNITRFASVGECGGSLHIDMESHLSDGWEFPTQGQTQSGQTTRWEAVNVGNPSSNPHAEIGDYIRLDSGSQAGEYRRVTGIISNNRLQLASAWSVDQGPVDFSIIRRWKSVKQTVTRDDLWGGDVEDLAVLNMLLLQLQARVVSETPTGTRDQIVARINSSPIDLRMA